MGKTQLIKTLALLKNKTINYQQALEAAPASDDYLYKYNQNKITESVCNFNDDVDQNYFTTPMIGVYEPDIYNVSVPDKKEKFTFLGINSFSVPKKYRQNNR